jgi:hypothetical protein
VVFKAVAVAELMVEQVGLPEPIQLKRRLPRTLSGKTKCQLCITQLDPKFREIYKDAQLNRLPLRPLPMLFQDCLPFH